MQMYARAVSSNVLGKLFLRKTWTRVSRGDATETDADCLRICYSSRGYHSPALL